MWYKRYGYKHPAKSDGIGCFSALASVIAGFVVALPIASEFQNLWLLFLGIPVTFFGFWIAEKKFSKQPSLIRERRFQYHLRKAKKYLAANDFPKAGESLRRAKMYGKLPPELQKVEKDRR